MAERIVQEDFSAGMFPAVAPELIPANGAEDITNGLLDDQGAIYRRGGGSVVTSGLAGVPRMLWAGYLGGAYREVIITSSRLYTDAGLTNVGAYTGMASRPLNVAVLGDMMYLPGGYTFDGTTLAGGTISADGDRIAAVAGRILLGRGDRVKFSLLFHTGTGSTTSGSPSITAVATTKGQFQAGMEIYGDGIPADARIGTFVGTTITLVDGSGNPLNATKTAAGVALSASGTQRRYDPTDYHRFPEGATVTGIVGLRDRAAVFTTQGLWLISNLAFNLTDADGNVQQRLDQYSPHLWLWNDTPAAVATYGESLIVPATDGVWLLALGVASEAPQPQQMISGPIASLYRSYFTGGYVPGQAAVFANHYLLPVLDASGAVVDVLVCRLDATNSRGQRIYPWTHFKGSQLPAALNPAPFAGTSWGSGLFLHGLFPTAATTTAWGGLEFFGPDPQGTRHAADPDGSVHRLEVTTRTFAMGTRATFIRLKATYRMSSGAGTATVTAEQAPGPAATFASLTGTAPENATGVNPYTWPVGKASREMRFRLRSGTGTAPTEVLLRGLDIRARVSSRV